jgi:hypothetical protein
MRFGCGSSRTGFVKKAVNFRQLNLSYDMEKNYDDLIIPVD